eukprot:gene27429-10537_t
MEQLMEHLRCGAGCHADGSPVGAYILRGDSPGAGNYFTPEADCAARRLSSNLWAPTAPVTDGILSRNCSHSPDFCRYSVALIPSCDGNLWLGARPPFRGNANLRAAVRGLFSVRGRVQRLNPRTLVLLGAGLAGARRVLFGGCGGGGTAVYHYADEVGGWIAPHLRKGAVFKAL